LLEILSQCRSKAKLTGAFVSTKNKRLKDILNYYLPSERDQGTLPLFGHE